MGSSMSYICKRCETHFGVRSGGGFDFDELHCDQCGRAERIEHRWLGDEISHAIAQAKLDRWIQANHPGEPLSQDEYVAAADAAGEAALDPCVCGGRFKHDAPPRCPTCRSTSELWDRDPKATHVHYD